MKKGIDFNWEKKISLKEIAQFYEDKLREEDAKVHYLDNQISILNNKIAELNTIINRNKKDSEELVTYMQKKISSSVENYLKDYGHEILYNYLMNVVDFHDDIINSVHYELLKDLKEFGNDINLQRKIHVFSIDTSRGRVHFKTPFEFIAIMDPWQHGNMYVNDAFLGIYEVASTWDMLIRNVLDAVASQYEKIVFGEDPCEATGDISDIKSRFVNNTKAIEVKK